MERYHFQTNQREDLLANLDSCLWQRMGQILKAGDIVVAESGNFDLHNLAFRTLVNSKLRIEK
jgi:TPP-dependent 2-oxoacid decarboxylase